MRAGWVAVGLELAFGVAVWAWLRGAGGDGPWTAAACAAPAAVGVLVARSRRDDLRQYLARVGAALAFGPVLLLFWAASQEPPAGAPPAAAARTLDAERLFAGAVAVQDVDLRAGGVELMRQGAFADGTEVRLARLPDAAAAARRLALLADAMPGERVDDGTRRGWRWRGEGFALHVAERHGRDVLEVRAVDAARGAERLAALPPADAPEAPDAAPGAPPRPTWPILAGGFALHVALFVGFVLWAGGATTALAPAAGVPPVPAETLHARLRSLAAPDAPFTVAEEAPGALVFDVERLHADRRTHRIVLHLDAARRAVRVRERLGARGARPRDADEASMRRVGDPLGDAARPPARRVWAATAQATVVDAARLAAVPLELDGARAAVPAADLAALDGEGLVTLLAALVTRSGWHWRPALFGRAAVD